MCVKLHTNNDTQVYYFVYEKGLQNEVCRLNNVLKHHKGTFLKAKRTYFKNVLRVFVLFCSSSMCVKLHRYQLASHNP